MSQVGHSLLHTWLLVLVLRVVSPNTTRDRGWVYREYTISLHCTIVCYILSYYIYIYTYILKPPHSDGLEFRDWFVGLWHRSVRLFRAHLVHVKFRDWSVEALQALGLSGTALGLGFRV